MALDRTVVSEKTVPDYELLLKEPAIVLLDSYTTIPDSLERKLTSTALPRSQDVAFSLLSSDQVKALANSRGSYVYLYVDDLEVSNDTGRVWISTTWALSEADSNVILLSGGRVQLQYLKQRGQWLFDRVLQHFIS
jgi:hypothetical protein